MSRENKRARDLEEIERWVLGDGVHVTGGEVERRVRKRSVSLKRSGEETRIHVL